MPYLTDREAKSFVSNHHICTKLSSEPGFKWHHPQLADTVTCLGCIQISDHCSQGKATHSCRALQQPTCTSGTAISGSVRKTCWCCAWVYAILYSTTISCNPATCNVTLYRHPHPTHRPCQSSERQWDVAAGCFYYYHHRSATSWLCHSSKRPIII